MARDIECPPCEHRVRKGKRPPLRLLAPQEAHQNFVHGDDYVSSGSVEAMSWLEKELEEAYEITTQKIGMTEGYTAEGKVMNRVIRRTSD